MADNVSATVLDHLVQQQLVSFERATELRQLMEAGDTLHDLVVSTEEVSEQDFGKAYASASGMGFVELKDVVVPKEILGIIPESTARGHMIVAYGQNEQGLQVAMANASDRQIVEFIHKKVDMPVQVAVASEEGIRSVLAQYQVTLEVELQDLVKQAQAVQRTENAGEAAEDLPIIKITDAVLKHAILQGASDIHIEPTETEVVIRYRVDGMLHDVLRLPKVVIAGMVARIKVQASLKIDEHRLPQDGRFKMQSDDYKVAFRVSVLPVFDGEKVVMRLLDESGQGLGLDDLGMSKRTMNIFRDNITKPHGMVLVTGPTGSGKTTTLYGAMKELNKPEVNISTIEDPIEYRMERINQTQVKPKIGLTFSNGLRALVRQDPDIIMVGEIRDEETAALALKPYGIRTHITKSKLEAEKYWTIRRESFSLLRNKIKDKHTAPFIDDFAVKPAQLSEFLPKLTEILSHYDIEYTIAGHVGDANFHIIPLLDFTQKSQRDIIPELSEKVYSLVFEFNGSMSGEHNDGLVRSPYLEQMYGKEIYTMFEQIKTIFDPKNIFNPGKKVWSSKEYALKHIIRE